MAGRIPQEFLDQLLSRVDLVEVINARTPLRRAGHEYIACCPFHAEKTPSFSVSPRKQFYHCFGCGAHGNAIGFLMDYERLEFLDAVEELARMAGLEVPKGSGDESRSSRGLLEWLAQADHFFRRQLREHPLRQRAVDYLRQRGLTGQIATRFGIGYAPPGWENLVQAMREAGADSGALLEAGLASHNEQGRLRDRFRDRIIFPIRDRRGRAIAFGGRALDSTNIPKYLNSPETPLFRKRTELYGLYEAHAYCSQLQRLLVVEGYLDVVALAQHGVNWAVATLGTATSTGHIERLFRMVDALVFCFDGDRAGRAAGWRALEVALPFLRDGRQINFLFLPEGEDPDSLIRREGQAAFEQRLAQAMPLADYLFAQLRTEADLSTLAGRARLAELARPLLEKLPDGHFRDLMAERLQQDAKLPRNRLQLTESSPVPDIAAQRARLIRTPLRKAIALLLYDPELAQTVPVIDPVLRQWREPGVRLLVELLDLLHGQPQLCAAAVLERYRDTNEGAILERLAQWIPEPEPALTGGPFGFDAEFPEIINHLQQKADADGEAWRHALLQRAPGTLSVAELNALRNFSGPEKTG